jgi:RNA:NAD 2'-phosphotransferase (TPT1/KptA family)
MKQFVDFIKEDDDYYYHGTSHANADSILKHGLDTKKSVFSGKTYLTRSYMLANKYSKSGAGKMGVVLKVKKSALKPEHTIHHDSSGVIEYTDHIHPDHISKA